jgi:hypothetical protein
MQAQNMLDRPKPPSGIAARKFREAGLVYLFAGSAVVVFTVLAGLVPASRTAQRFLLVVGLPFVVLLGVLLTSAQELWRWSWTVEPIRWLARLLTITNAVRTLLFLLNAAGWNVHVIPRFFVLHTAPNVLFLVNVALMCLITVTLARAGWSKDEGEGARGHAGSSL